MTRWSRSRPFGPLAVLVALVLLAGACTGSDGDDGVSEGAAVDPIEGASSDDASPAGGDGDAGDEGLGQSGLGRVEAIESIGGAETVRLPNIPPIVAPDLSTLSATGRDFDGDLTGILGLDVVSASCSAQGGELVYQGSTDSSFFDLAADGSGVYQEDGLDVTVAADGSGSFRDTRDNRDVAIEVAADGSGSFTDRSFAIDLSLQVAGDGSGVFRDQSHNNDLTIELAGDGSGSYRDRGFRTIDVEVGTDGAARYEDLAGSQQHEVWSEPDGTWTYRRVLDNDELTLTVAPDGSGSFRRTGELAEIAIEVDGDGNAAYTDQGRNLDLRFVTDGGILDPGLVEAAPTPEFVVAERFPPLDGLAQMRPPCVSILRLDADVLFDFDSAELQPETARVVERLAQALAGAAVDQGIEIHGHTDAIGDEAYNQDLAARRAEAFAAALREAGVTAELRTMSFGETTPVAPNERADGSDDPAGRQLNRRIEIVIPE